MTCPRSAPRFAPVRLLGLASLAALTLVPPAARAHHPVGIPQYRELDGGIVMIYNVLTEDYVVRLQAKPGRPACPPVAPVELAARITPRDPAVTFSGGTWLSLVEELGNEGERELRSPTLESREAGPRALEASFTFERPGDYVVRIEFTESPGREVLSFPLPVERSGGSPVARALKLLLPAVLVVGALVLARLAARRRAAREGAGGAGG